MATIIWNKSKQAVTFNLPCPKNAEGECAEGCLCTTIETRTAIEFDDGTKGVQVLDRKLPGSVTVLAGGRSEVPSWAGKSPEVKAALARGAVRLITE